MDDKAKLLEGEKTDNLEGTSTSVEGDAITELNNSPVPTPEEQKEADMVASNNESPDVPAEPVQPESDTSNSNENVEPNVPVDNADVTATTNAAENNGENAIPPAAPEEPTPEKTFTQSQVNELVGKTRMDTREQTYRAIYGRYGVEDEAGMDALVGNAQRYDTLKADYDTAKKEWDATNSTRDAELLSIKEQVALLESGIDRNRFDDAKAIIKAKGLEVNAETIKNELATHPEWNGSNEKPNPNYHKDPNAQPQPITPTPESTIKVLGNEGDNSRGSEMSEEEFVLKNLYKM